MRRMVVVMMALAIAGAVSVEAVGGVEFPGNAMLAGRGKLKVKRCGKASGPTSLTVVVAADGDWAIDDGTATLAGTGAIVGKAGRKLVFTLDDASLASVVAMLEAEASALCGVGVTVTDVTPRKAFVKVNSKGTHAHLVVALTATGTADDATSGKAKYRVVADGRWVGPLSCEDIFACTRACAIDNAACAEACMAQGALETQADVTALNQCIATVCPFGDPVCIGDAIGGACKTVYEACVPPPPPTNLTCEEIFDCAEECEAQSCVDDCFDRGSQRGEDEAVAVSNCVNRVCPVGGAACQAIALAGACAYLWEECSGTPPPQNFGCVGILNCFDTCPAGSAVCRGDCRNRGSLIGQVELMTLEECLDAACPTRDPVCVATTITGQCRTEWADCVG